MRELKTDEELKTIAKDLHASKIFTNRHLDRPEDAPIVFMVLGLMKHEDLQKLIDDGVCFIYEYIKEAMPSACNDMPMFLSFQYLYKDEYTKMIDYYNKIVEAMEAI